MNFSHLVQINDALNPLIAPLSRVQLWRGLVLRAENPLLFVLGLDRFEILERGENTLARVLHFGQLRLHDRVFFSPMTRVYYEIEATADSPAASLTMTIEEPRPEELFVRFDYATRQDAGGAMLDEFYTGIVRQAYVKNDMDTISTIRRLAAQAGTLG